MSATPIAPWSPQSGTNAIGLPSDLVAQCNRRLQILILIYASIYFITVFVIPDSPADRAAFDHRTAHILGVFFISTSIAFFLVINRGWITTRHEPLGSLLFEVYGAIGIEIGILLWDGNPDAIRLGLSWTTVWIVCFPLFVPSRPRHTFWASTLAASAMPAMLIISASRGIPTLDSATLAQIIVPNYLCVGIAVLASHVLYGLGRNVAEARRMGSYQLDEKIGEGGMGEVWKASHLLLARPAAIKLVRSDLTADPATLERFEREVQATAQLRSQHTIAVYDYGVTPDGVFYYVMELLDGFDLEGLIPGNGPLHPSRVIRIMKQACHSLAEAHEHGLIHRDIKPANMFLCRYGREVDFTKVLDFGLVKHSDRSGEQDLMLTKVGSFTGTPTYASPEMAEGQGRVDHRTDIYSLGCVGFWLLTISDR